MNDTKTAKYVAKWLNTLPNHSNAKPVRVKIGRTTYIGASFTLTHDTGKIATEKGYYLLGRLPASRKNRRNLVYRSNLDGDSDIFIGGWITAQGASNPKFASFHPFGANLSLYLWQHEVIGRIDLYGLPYKRMNITILPLDTKAQNS